MHVGINLNSKLPIQDAINALLENGIDRTFVCIEHPQFTEAMCALIKAGITVDSFHAPFKNQNRIWEEGEAGELMLADFLKSVDYCVEYGVPILVAHVSNGRPMPPISEIGLDRYDKFVSYARSKGIQIAFENHRYAENVQLIMARYPDMGFCLDTSHENGFTPGINYMEMWTDRLIATHLSDNEYVCDKDMHMIPFDGNIDFAQVARQIAKCPNEVTLMLEIKPTNHPKYKDMPIKEYYAAAAESIRKFAHMVEECKNQNA